MILTTKVLQPVSRQLIASAVLTAAFAVSIDEALKTLVRATMDTCTAPDAVGREYLNAGGVTGILHIENAGSAVGLVQGSWAWLPVAGPGLLLIPLCGSSAKGWDFAVACGAGLMAGGALGNFFDRLIYGSVTDFIALGETIVINPADVVLLAGPILMTRAIWQARSRSAPESVMIGLEAVAAD